MRNKIEKNCNSCKHGLFSGCKALKENSEYQNIWGDAEKYNKSGSLEAFKYKDDFCCEEYKCKYIQFPIEVSKFNYDISKNKYADPTIGKFVRIKPCESNKTHLGIYLGDLPVGIRVSHNSENKELNLSYDKNPAILVFDLNKIVYGMESWWGVIEDPKDLAEITDIDINDLWYVKALKSITKEN